MKNHLVRASSFLLAFAFILLSKANVEEKMITGHGTTAKVLGSSGKIILMRGKHHHESDAKMIFEFDEIKEYEDMNRMTAVGMTGSAKHSFNNFAHQMFTFSDVEDGYYQNLSMTYFNFSSEITSVNANIFSSIYIFNESGSITTGNETTEVKNGSIKFNVEISNWKFCAQAGAICRHGNEEETGNYLDLVISVKSRSKPRARGYRRRSHGDEYTIDDHDIILSRKVNLKKLIFCSSNLVV